MEFALLVPLLVMILLAMADYGIWYTDSANLRHGAREGARQGAVSDFSGSPACAAAPGPAEATACVTRERISPMAGQPLVRVFSRGHWRANRELTVCAMMRETGITGYTPMPKDGWLRTRVVTRIERNYTGTGATSHTDPAPGPNDWDWCPT